MLEMYHIMLAMFANNGMSEDLCDLLSLHGTARFNHRLRHKRCVNQLSVEEQERIPVEFRDVPRFCDHSALAALNARCTKLGLTTHFSNLTTLCKDNGERFFSEYLQPSSRAHTTIRHPQQNLVAAASQSNLLPILPNVGQPIPQGIRQYFLQSNRKSLI